MTAGNSNKEPIIQVRNISKQYNIGMDRTYKTFSESFTNVLKSPIKSLRSIGYQHDTFWALKDINFNVNRGEVVGIIGRNGAGKSTLLKILSRITTPTEGEIHLKGRVGSLLEVGTGFHPELTGRENIYFNGAILGMKKKEIDDKFDEIVKFSGVEKFLDTPVKRYSSGMQVRLAFSVAANLDPEILIVDEVLAVGDAEFQKKCLGKMGEIAEGGRTVLFVSHNMNAIASLCQRGIVLEIGKILIDDEIKTSVSRYLHHSSQFNAEYNRNKIDYNKKLNIESVKLLKYGDPSICFNNSDILTIEIQYSINEHILGAQIALEIYTDSDICLFTTTDQDWTGQKIEYTPGKYIAICPLDLKYFREGKYYIKVSSSIPKYKILDVIDNSLVFEVFDDSSPILKLGQGRKGIILPKIKWRRLK